MVVGVGLHHVFYYFSYSYDGLRKGRSTNGQSMADRITSSWNE